MSLMSLAWDRVSLPGQSLSLGFDRREGAFPKAGHTVEPESFPRVPSASSSSLRRFSPYGFGF